VSVVIQERVSASRAAWGACLMSFLALLGMLWWTRTRIELSVAVSVFLPGTAFALLHAAYTWVRPVPKISALTGALAVLFLSSFASVLMAVASLRSGAPLIDPLLAGADAALGLDTQALVLATAEWPRLGRLLRGAYLMTVPAVLLAIGILAIVEQTDRMWEATFAFAASAAFCSFSMSFLPAVAAFAYYGTDVDPRPAYEAVIALYRSGAVDTIQLSHLAGVGTFPSFHATMAAIVIFGLRRIPVLSVLSWIWGGLVLIATVSFGGHYAIDLPAGVALFALSVCLVRARPIRSAAPQSAA